MAKFPIFLDSNSENVAFTFPESGSFELEARGNSMDDSFQDFNAKFEYYARAGLIKDVNIISSTEFNFDFQEANRMQDYFLYIAIGAGLMILLMFLLPAQLKGEKFENH